MPNFKHYIYKAKTWLVNPDNKKKVILSSIGLAVLGATIAGIYLAKATSIEQVLAKVHQPFASGILFFKKDNDSYQVLLGKNSVNTWQDFGGMREWGETSQHTALREAAEESCLLCDDLSMLPTGFKIQDTKTYQSFAAAIKNHESFYIDYHNSRGIYRLYVAPLPDCMNTNNFAEHRHYVVSNPIRFDAAALTETHHVDWLDAQTLYDFVKNKQPHHIAPLNIDGKSYLIRAKCYGSFAKGLAKLLGK